MTLKIPQQHCTKLYSCAELGRGFSLSELQNAQNSGHFFIEVTDLCHKMFQEIISTLKRESIFLMQHLLSTGTKIICPI